MAFERKETTNEKPRTIFWTILKWYWLILPSFYFLLIVPNMVQSGNVPLLEAGDVFNLIFQLLNYGLAGLMTVTNPLEQSKSGAGDKLLKIAVVQQFVAQNYFGVVLTVLAWYQLPYKVEPEMVEPEEAEKWHFQPKTILILAIVILTITLLSALGQITLA